MGTQHIDEQNKLNKCELKNQDTTKITSALADSRSQFSWSVMTISVRTLCLCLALMTPFLSVSSLFFSFVTMSSSKPAGVETVNRLTRNASQRREDYYYDALAFSRHNINLVFDEETMKTERLTKAPEKCRHRSKYHETEEMAQDTLRE